ncbi:MAG TPA: DUF6036 family nucleotidyltransferase [Steroidobacteraceae bacterium]|nr:DUF6036 family nucleotidyltransferase [Steroidobacteraceae bacterium]
MKKQQVDHVLRAAGRITGQKRFIIVGSQALHGSFPDVADDIEKSAEVDLVATEHASGAEWLNAIGYLSSFHETFGYYADPVDRTTATLPNGWEDRLVRLSPGDTDGVQGLCLDPHDLAISKYVAGRGKDLTFTHELAARGLVSRATLLALLEQTRLDDAARERIRGRIASDFQDRTSRGADAHPPAARNSPRERKQRSKIPAPAHRGSARSRARRRRR